MGIFDDLKSIGKTFQEAGKIEQYNQILETQKELLEMQKKIIDLESEKVELKEKLKIRGKLIPKNNAYWLAEENGREDGPFCTRCYDKDEKLLRMLPREYGSSSCPSYCYTCPECNNTIKKI